VHSWQVLLQDVDTLVPDGNRDTHGRGGKSDVEYLLQVDGLRNAQQVEGVEPINRNSATVQIPVHKAHGQRHECWRSGSGKPIKGPRDAGGRDKHSSEVPRLLLGISLRSAVPGGRARA